MESNFILLATSILLGIFFICLSIPLIHKKIPPNNLYGLRIHATLSNKNVWYEANVKFGKDMTILGLWTTLVGCVLYVIKMALWLKILISLVMVEGGIIWALVRSFRFANKLLLERESKK